MDFLFDGIIAISPATNLPEPNGVGQVYARDDVELTAPLSVRIDGVTRTSVPTGPLGQIVPFWATDHARVWWVSGGVRIPLTSVDGLLRDAQAAQEAAETAATEARSAYQALLDYVSANPGGTPGGGGGGGVSDHGALSGLGDDDHVQYLNAARGDARYYRRADVDNIVLSASTATSSQDRDRANHYGEQGMSTVAGLSTALNARPQIVVYAGTAWPSRPSVPHVLWLDYTGAAPNPPGFQEGADVLLQDAYV